MKCVQNDRYIERKGIELSYRIKIHMQNVNIFSFQALLWHKTNRFSLNNHVFYKIQEGHNPISLT